MHALRLPVVAPAPIWTAHVRQVQEPVLVAALHDGRERKRERVARTVPDTGRGGVTVAQPRGVSEWVAWAYGHGFPGAVGVEQAFRQSVCDKTCARCGERGELVLQDSRAWIKSTDYYLCRECRGAG